MMIPKKILFICGSLNQTSMMHQISLFFPNDECWFSPYYADGIINYVVQLGYLNFSILNGTFRRNTEKYLSENNLKVDYRGVNNDYDLVFTCADLIYPKNIRNKKVILVQEGMTDPETILFFLVKYLKLPRWIGSTSTMGMSYRYNYFCVASNGYKEFFIKRKKVDVGKLIVTGIPNFDNVKEFLVNDFPHKDYVLICTSDGRETCKLENRMKFLQSCVKIAGERKMIFKLHPNENVKRATREINSIAPEAMIFTSGNTNQMVANCHVLITQYSSVAFVGLALSKEVHSYFDVEELKQLLPWQNNGTSAKRIAEVGNILLEQSFSSASEIQNKIDLIDR